MTRNRGSRTDDTGPEIVGGLSKTQHNRPEGPTHMTETRRLSSGYRVIPSVFASASTAHLAPRRPELADALADMGTGIVIDTVGRVVAFHESHLEFVAAGVGDYRV